jgi:hypothetical protein
MICAAIEMPEVSISLIVKGKGFFTLIKNASLENKNTAEEYRSIATDLRYALDLSINIRHDFQC